MPAEPVVFLKATSAIVGPNDDVIIPRGSTKTDWEVELAVVIGKQASYVDEADALDHVAGYVLHNDYTERDSSSSAAASGTRARAATRSPRSARSSPRPTRFRDVHDLSMWLTVNGERKQNGRRAIWSSACRSWSATSASS